MCHRYLDTPIEPLQIKLICDVGVNLGVVQRMMVVIGTPIMIVLMLEKFLLKLMCI